MGARGCLALSPAWTRTFGDNMQREGAGSRPGPGGQGPGPPGSSAVLPALAAAPARALAEDRAEKITGTRPRPDGVCPSSLLPHYEVYLSFLGPGQYLTTEIYANEIMNNLGKGMKCGARSKPPQTPPAGVFELSNHFKDDLKSLNRKKHTGIPANGRPCGFLRRPASLWERGRLAGAGPGVCAGAQCSPGRPGDFGGALPTAGTQPLAWAS